MSSQLTAVYAQERDALQVPIFNNFSEHADGERRGPCAHLKVPKGHVSKGPRRCRTRICASPSAFTVGMLRKFLKISALCFD